MTDRAAAPAAYGDGVSGSQHAPRAVARTPSRPPVLAADLSAGLAAELAAARARLEPGFDSALADVLDATEEVSTLDATLSAFAQSTDAKAMEALGRATDALRAGAIEVRAEAGRFRDAGERLDRLTARARLQLSNLQQQNRMATLVAMNAQIVSVTTGGGHTSLEGFAGDMRRLFERMKASTAEFSGDLETELGQARHLRDLAQGVEQEARTGLIRALGGLVDRAGVMAADRSLAQATESLSRRATQLGPLVAQLMPPMQVGDELRQRLEHVEAALTGASDQDGAAAGEMRLLALRLLEPAATEAHAKLTEAQRLLGHLSERMATLAVEQTLDAALSGPAAEAAQVTRLAEDAVATLSRLEAGRDAARKAAGAISLPASHLETLRQLRHQMTLLAQNAILISHRTGEEGRAMEEVSLQLRRLTDEISDELLALEATLAELTQVSDGLATDAPAAEIDLSAAAELERLTARISAAMPEAEMAAGVAGLRGRLARALATTRELVEGVTGIATLGARLRDSGLPGAARAGTLPEALLDGLRQGYTMESERQIHDALFPWAAPRSEPEGNPDSDFDMFEM